MCNSSFCTEYNALSDVHAFHIVVKSFKQVVILTFDGIFTMQPKG